MEYNEGRVLTKYIWDHYYRLMTEFEREVDKAIIGREKARSTDNEVLSEKLNLYFGRVDRDDINDALEVGPETFRERVRDRILRDYPEEVTINRCPTCQRIVRTPVARLCTWCGYTWFKTENQ